MSNMPNIKTEWILLGLGIGAALIFVPGLLKTGARNIGQAPGAFLGGVSGGLGTLIQENTPFPNTTTPESQTLCQKAIADGDDLMASFYCPAGTWLGGLFDGEWF